MKIQPKIYNKKNFILAVLTYFFFISTFCWMNVMSFDIWWTFRGYAKVRRIHRRGEYFKFFMYVLYAWGVPLAMAVGLAVINATDFSDKLWIVKPQIPIEGCFLENGQKLLYLYVPMLILILCNWLFFLMTAFNIWRLGRGTSVLDTAAAGSPAAHRKQRNRLHAIMGLVKILVILFYLSSVTSFISDIVLEKESDITKELCKARKCIRKCCPKDEHYSSLIGDCMINEKPLDFSNITVYDDDDHSKAIKSTLSDIFLLVPGMFGVELKEKNYTPFIEVAYVMNDYNVPTYLTENGKLFMEIKNSYNRWYPIDYFCVDHEVGNDTTVKFWSVVIDVYIPKGNAYYASALLISSIFLFLVLLVYLVLPEYRKLVDLILMSYIICLMGAFLSLASLQIGNYSDVDCIVLTVLTYFFFISTFCWMNVMSFDIWWTFRGYAKARRIHRRGEYFKFFMYGLYAWGVPLAMAVGLAVINATDLSDKPWIVKPQIPIEGCFLENGQKLLYLYVPMLILILCNWLFFLMTAFNIWRLSRGTSVLDTAAAGSPAAHRKQRNRLMVYLKLSVIMGINWVLEVVSFLTPEFKIWYISDAYNLLIGFSIFLIFVCKKKMYKKLKKRYYSFVDPKPQLRKNNSSTSTLESNLSQEIPLQVSTDPTGQNKKPTVRVY